MKIVSFRIAHHIYNRIAKLSGAKTMQDVMIWLLSSWFDQRREIHNLKRKLRKERYVRVNQEFIKEIETESSTNKDQI